MDHLDDIIVNVVAPARLHMGFIDMHGGLGRQFGSLGLSVSEIFLDLRVSKDPGITADGPGHVRAEQCANKLISYLGINNGVHIQINHTIPEHAGLGSGTQMALAVGTAISRLYEMEISIEELATILDRGNRSGIGIGTFKYGGFIVDGGRNDKTEVPPIICHMDIPEAWRFILVLDNERQGINGLNEREAFETLPCMDERIVADLCRVTLIQLLPAIIEEDCKQFGGAITSIQQAIGEHFKIIQGGCFYSPAVAVVLSKLAELGATGYGQSSWGPTGFAVFASETDAYQAL